MVVQLHKKMSYLINSIDKMDVRLEDNTSGPPSFNIYHSVKLKIIYHLECTIK